MPIEYRYSLGDCKTVWDNGKTYDYENWDSEVSKTFYIQCGTCKHSTDDEAYTRDRFGNIEINHDSLYDIMKFMIEHSESHSDNANFKFIDHLMAYTDSNYGNKGKPLKEFKPIRMINIEEAR